MCWYNGNGGTSNLVVGGSSLLAPTHMWYLKGRFMPVSDGADGDGEGQFLLVSDDDADGDDFSP